MENSRMTHIRLPYLHVFRDRHGKPRYYFRRPGFKQTPLHGAPGSTEFREAYEAALAGVTAPPREIGANRTKPGTVNAAIVGYYQSLAFRSLALGTQNMRRAIFERFRAEHGDKHIATLPQKFITHMLLRMKPEAARNWLKALRGLLEFAIAEGFRADNPSLGIKLPKHKTAGRHAWTDAEIAQFKAHYPIGTRERFAFTLLLETAQRRGDVIRMGPQHIRIGPEGSELYVKQQKTGTELLIPVSPELQQVFDVTPCKHLTFLVIKSGRPFSGDDFSKQFRTWCDAAGLPKRCTVHGMRHASLTRIANAGGTVHQIAAFGGHKSLTMVQRYTKDADQRRLAREAGALTHASETPATKKRTASGKPSIRFAKNTG
jgi:integrase